jgi:hypothetical protein
VNLFQKTKSELCILGIAKLKILSLPTHPRIRREERAYFEPEGLPPWNSQWQINFPVGV